MRWGMKRKSNDGFLRLSVCFVFAARDTMVVPAFSPPCRFLLVFAVSLSLCVPYDVCVSTNSLTPFWFPSMSNHFIQRFIVIYRKLESL